MTELLKVQVNERTGGFDVTVVGPLEAIAIEMHVMNVAFPNDNEELVTDLLNGLHEFAKKRSAAFQWVKK